MAADTQPAHPALTVRPMQAEDAPALDRFHEHLTRETARLRFFNTHPHLTPRELDRFTHVDHHDREALVAWLGDEIVAVARYERIDATTAEAAFVVTDEWQGHGVGSQMLELLIERAQANGFTRLVAETMPENDRMKQLFRHTGLPMSSVWDSGVVHMALDVSSCGRGD